MPKTTTSLEGLVGQLRNDFAEIQFIEGKRFAWDASGKIMYNKTTKNITHGIFSLLHELGHAVLAHKNYIYDIELLKIEVAAWEKAHEIAKNYNITLDDSYIQDCLDSYRDWLHIRATCPTCHSRCLQVNKTTYCCHNCNTTWHITRSRLCRPYRLQPN